MIAIPCTCGCAGRAEVLTIEDLAAELHLTKAAAVARVRRRGLGRRLDERTVVFTRGDVDALAEPLPRGRPSNEEGPE